MSLWSGYRREWLRGDLVAGVTVTAIAIPESLGYASIAGLPVQTGLYCALVPAVLFALVASSRQLVVGADSATAALVAAGAGAVVASSSSKYPGTVAVLVLLTAGLLLLMALARLGFLADLISQPVLAGFLSGPICSDPPPRGWSGARACGPETSGILWLVVPSPGLRSRPRGPSGRAGASGGAPGGAPPLLLLPSPPRAPPLLLPTPALPLLRSPTPARLWAVSARPT